MEGLLEVKNCRGVDGGGTEEVLEVENCMNKGVEGVGMRGVGG